MQRNQALNNELRQILQQIETQAEMTERLQRENQFLKKRNDIQNTIEDRSRSRKSSLSPHTVSNRTEKTTPIANISHSRDPIVKR